jgi:hypothetical protein
MVCFVVASSLFTFSGCERDGTDEERQAQVSEQDVLGYYQDILAFPRSGPSYPGGLDGYLLEQAEILGVEARKDEAGNVIMRSPATAGMPSARPVVLVAYTGADIAHDRTKAFDPYSDGVRLVPAGENARAEGVSMGADSALGAATILAVLKNSETHGEVTAYFAAGDGLARAKDAAAPAETVPKTPAANDADGASADKAAPPGFDFPENASVIEIGGPDTGQIIIGAPAATVLEVSCTTGAAESGDGRAYVIAAAGFPSGAARVENGEGGEDPVNPVEVIARVLSEAKSAGCAYGLSDFSGGADACLLPEEAQATVVLGDFEEAQFRRVFDRIADESIDRAGGAGSGATVRMIETERPASVIDPDAASKALTYIFGLMDMSMEESGDSAAVNIGGIALTKSSFACGIAVTGYDAKAVARTLREQYAFERLSGVTVKEAGVIPGFGGESPYNETSDERTPAGGTTDNEAAGGAAANEAGDEAYALLEEAYREVIESDVTQVSASAPNPLGRYAGGVTLQRIGISVHDKGTTGEYFPKSEAAVPANVLLRFLEK